MDFTPTSLGAFLEKKREFELYLQFRKLNSIYNVNWFPRILARFKCSLAKSHRICKLKQDVLPLVPVTNARTCNSKPTLQISHKRHEKMF